MKNTVDLTQGGQKQQPMGVQGVQQNITTSHGDLVQKEDPEISFLDTEKDQTAKSIQFRCSESDDPVISSKISPQINKQMQRHNLKLNFRKSDEYFSDSSPKNNPADL